VTLSLDSYSVRSWWLICQSRADVRVGLKI